QGLASGAGASSRLGYTGGSPIIEEAPPVPKTRRRNPSREQFWCDTIRAWKASGQCVRAFCAARGLSEATFYARRRERADREPHTTSGTPSGPSPTFAAVRVIPDPRVEVVLPAGSSGDGHQRGRAVAGAQSGGGDRNTEFPLAIPSGSPGKFWLSDTN